ncbi:MAG TPA: hypothetical protein VGF34_13890 [Stellaceae bacterium]|jgi:hypothetical protein
MKPTFGALLLAGALTVALPLSANAASNFTSGNFNEQDTAGTSFHDQGTCVLFAGPRGTLAANRFLMKLGDRHSSDHDELQITGDLTTFKSNLTGDTEYLLFPDDPSAANFFQNVLRRQLHDPRAIFIPYGFTARVSDVFGSGSEDAFTCHVSLTGRVNRAGKSTPVSLTFSGGGQFIAGIDRPKKPPANPAVRLAQVKAGPSCPTSELAPDGLNPLPGNGQCPKGSNCLLSFKGYQWWTSFNFRGQSFPDHSGYWNDGLKTPFAPANASVDATGLHLLIQDQDLGAPSGPAPAGSEVVLMFNSDGSPANLGYGQYLVTATAKTAGTWNGLDLNAAFGAFTFERFGTGGGTGTMNNPNREIDLSEISRFGWPANDPSCPSQANPPQLCQGNAQFTLQDWWENPNNVHRYSIGNTPATITLVMTWRGQGQPVTFQQYNKGGIHLGNLPAAADNTWTSASNQNIYIPGTNCERFHLNLWMGNYRGDTSPHPPPKMLPYEVVVTNFEFAPIK